MNLNKEKIIKHALNISIVIPCYNEDEVLNETTSQLNVILNSLIERKVITKTSKVYFIDDGSTDKTWSLIKKLSIKHENIHGLKLSRNCGHQNALLAGLMSADGDVVVSIDADLQDDLAAIEKMIDLYTYGYEIVYGVRESRSTDSFFKKLTAELYYKLLLLMGVEIIFNHADYRLLSRKAINSLRDFKEVNIFLRGIIPKLGYQHAVVYYNRSKRYAGESKYPVKKMLSFAWQGITSLSDIPLRSITSIGFFVSIISFFMSIWALYVKFFSDHVLPGWASTVLPIYFIGGIQLLCLGIIGEYVSKIYLETKNRPKYIVEKII